MEYLTGEIFIGKIKKFGQVMNIFLQRKSFLTNFPLESIQYTYFKLFFYSNYTMFEQYRFLQILIVELLLVYKLMLLRPIC